MLVTPCQSEDPAEIGTNPTTMLFRARCGCGQVVLESGTYDEAVEALTTHRPDPTPMEGP
jgi:hypothetical protein